MWFLITGILLVGIGSWGAMAIKRNPKKYAPGAEGAILLFAVGVFLIAKYFLGEGA